MRECPWRSGDIWLTLCDPSRGHEYQGTRPSVIVQEAFLPKERGLVTVMLMSSYKGKQWQHDILVQRDNTNRLRVDSLVKVQHIKSFDASRLLKKIGHVDVLVMGKIKAYLRLHFGIS